MKNPVKSALWGDYQLTGEEFNSILKGERSNGWLNQEWAVSRLLQHTNYYEVRSLLTLPEISKLWPKVKKTIKDKSLVQGYEFLLRRYALPATG